MTVDVQIASDDPAVPAQDVISLWVERALRGADGDPDADVAVRIVDDEEMRALNRDYRQQDRTTNVLSFPAGAIVGMPDGTNAVLGDIVVCASVVASEAARQHKAVGDHWGHMLVHGTLHLLGFDHASDDEAAVMERLETRILAEFGIADPYGARS